MIRVDSEVNDPTNPDDDPIDINSDLNASFYKYAYNNTFTPEQIQTQRIFKKAAKLHKRLMRLDDETGFNKFDNLNKDTQNLLKLFYGEENKYMIAQENFFNRVRLKVGESITSPFRGIIDLAAGYGRLVGGAVTGIQNISENKLDLSSPEGIVQAYLGFSDQDNVWNNELDQKYQDKYGPIKTFIAKASLQGRLPSEIIDSYAKANGKNLDPEFIDAMTSYLNEHDKWADGILEDYKQAGISPGRSFARAMVGTRSGKDLGLVGELTQTLGEQLGYSDKEIKKGLKNFRTDERDLAFTRFSATGDLAATILFDPLTYLTGGLSVGFKFMGKPISVMGNNLSKVNAIAKAGNVKGLFSQPEVIGFWDQYGAKIEELAIAREAKDYRKADDILNVIKTQFNRHNTDPDIELALNNKFYNAVETEKYFTEAQDLSYLMAGRTAKTSYYRMGVASARDARVTGINLRRAWYELATKGSSSVDVNADVEKLADELIGLATESGVKSATPILDKAAKDVLKFRSRAVRQLSLHPSDETLITAENAGETFGVVRQMAQLIAPRDLSGALAERFLASTQDERINILAGLTRGILIKMGIGGLHGGTKLIEDFVNAKYGKIGMKSTLETAKPSTWANVVKETSDDLEGAIFEHQTVPYLGALDWNTIADLSASAGVKTWGKSGYGRTQVGRFVGGLINHKAVTTVVNSWVFTVLMPKLGIRSAIDEATFGVLTMPAQVGYYILSGKAKSGGKAITRFTTNKDATGVAGNILRKMFAKPLGAVGIKGMDPLSDIPLERREDLLTQAIDYARRNKLPDEAIMPIFREYLAEEALSYAHLLNPEEAGWMAQRMIHSPHTLSSEASSAARASGLGTIDEAVAVHYLTPTELTKALEDLGIKRSSGSRVIDPNELTENSMKFIMYDNFFFKFYSNKIGKLDLYNVFLKHNALKTGDDANAFIDEITEYITSSPEMIKSFLNKRRGVDLLRKSVNSDKDIIRKYAHAMASDMYVTFHGDENFFNHDLYDWVVTRSKADVFKELNFPTYSNIIGKNFRNKAVVSNIDPSILENGKILSVLKKFGDNAYPAMDRTVNSLFRQPAMTAYYLYFRDMFKQNEKNYLKNLIDKLQAESQVALTPDVIARIEQRALRQTEKIFVERADKAAIGSVLKFVDNPHVRSNLVVSMRNVGRFNRASEDFWRRIVRLKDNSARTIYRTRLINNGFNNVGSTHEDADGNRYFIIPTDNIIFSVLDGALKAVSGTGLMQPLTGSSYSVKLSSMNPSFQDQAGIPFLAGPVATIGVIGLQTLANAFGGENGPKLADDLDNLLLGEMGDNLQLKSLIPPIAIRMYSIINEEDKEEFNHSAVLSALSAQYAYGDFLPVDASPEERQRFLDTLRIGAHNFVIMRSVMSTLLPFSVGAQETGDLPDYLLDNGTQSMTQEYYDILDSVIRNYGDTLSDPYEVAMTMFVGKNPGKLAYTIQRNKKEAKALIAQTNQTKDWILSNGKFIDNYADTGAAYFFAPQLGDKNLGMYRWMQAAGLVDDIPTVKFLKSLQVIDAKQKYFAISDWENEELAKTASYDERRLISYKAQIRRKALKDANPFLAKALTPDGGFDVTQEEDILKDIKEILDDKAAPISKAERKRVAEALDVYKTAYDFITNPVVSSQANSTQIKLGTRDRVLAELERICYGDRMLQQMYSKLFKPVLKFYSRDNSSATAIG
jgi:hypothetical protein